jgi:hypothetical protein
VRNNGGGKWVDDVKRVLGWRAIQRVVEAYKATRNLQRMKTLSLTFKAALLKSPSSFICDRKVSQ